MKELTQEQIKTIIDAGKFGLNASQIASNLDLLETEVLEALNNPSNEAYRYYKKGKDMFMLDALRGLEEKANTGDWRAAREIMRITKELRDRKAIDDYFNL